MFSCGEILKIQNEEYDVAGVIQFKSLSEPSIWEEYRLFNKRTKEERWLSYDDYNSEYSMSKVVMTARGGNFNHFDGYHEVDRGRARVVASRGNVDVDFGELVDYIEFEDANEDNIKSVEIWCDGVEISEGYYIEKSDVVSVGKASMPGLGMISMVGHGGKGINSKNIIGLSMGLLILLSSFGGAISGYISGFQVKSMETFIKGSPNYTYRTSVTSNINSEEKANVYSTSLTVDAAAKDIINGIDGATESVQQNTEDSDDDSVAIMTKKEYCLVYTDSDTSETLVQISTRLYAYTSDSDVYHSRRSTSRYYRRYYYSRGYSSDKGSYGDYTSSYGSYNDSPVSTNSSDTYSTYSNTVRQASAASRSSSGGGTRSGK